MNKKLSKFQDVILYIGKYAWIVALLVIVVFGRDQFAEMIHTFTNWEEVKAARGDVILEQNLFVRDRFYLSDPESYSVKLVADNGEYMENRREGADIILEQKKFLFSSGDVFRQLRMPHSEGVELNSADTLKMILSFRYGSGKAYYYDEESRDFVLLEHFRGGTRIPSDRPVYFNFSDQYYVLMSPMNAYSAVEEGIVVAAPEKEYPIFLNTKNGGWDIMRGFRNEEGLVNEFWTLESTRPLIDMDDSSANLRLFRDINFSDENLRLLYDGCYSAIPEGYTPDPEGGLWRDSSLTAAAVLAKDGNNPAEQDLGFIQMFAAARAVAQKGFVETVLQNTAIYRESGIKYGYVDSKANADLGIALLDAAAAYGESYFRDSAGLLADYFLKIAAGSAAEGPENFASLTAIPDFFREGGEVRYLYASKESLRAEADFLAAAGRALGRDDCSLLASELESCIAAMEAEGLEKISLRAAGN